MKNIVFLYFMPLNAPKIGQIWPIQRPTTVLFVNMYRNYLIISPEISLTEPTNVLMSRRLSRFIDKYASLDAEQREKLEDFIEKLLPEGDK